MPRKRLPGKRPHAPPRGFSPDRTPDKFFKAYISVFAHESLNANVSLSNETPFLLIRVIHRSFFLRVPYDYLNFFSFFSVLTNAKRPFSPYIG